MKERAASINQKWKQIEKKIGNAQTKKEIYSLKHRELDNLRFEDLNENLEVLKNQNFMQKCKIGEKHMALSAMNSDKRLYLESSNDRMRCRIVKERQLVSTD